LSDLAWYLGSTGHTREVNRSDLDSYADASVVGRESFVIQDCDHHVTVNGFDPTRAARSLRAVSAALTYTIPECGRMVCLIVHQAIHEPNLSHNFLIMMHMRLNDVVVHDTPKFQCEVLNDLSHTIMVRGKYEEVLNIPMFIKGVTSCFKT
jgi:hypothetical protein